MVEMNIAYEGNLRCLATHGPSGSTLRTVAPKDNQGDGSLFSPTDLVATALGTCMLTILGIVARRHDIDLSDVTVKVQKEMATTGIRRIARLPVEFRLPIDLTPEQQSMFEEAAMKCPVHKSLHTEIQSPVTFIWGKDGSVVRTHGH